MERAYDERIALYFCRKNRGSAFLLIVLGFGIWSVGFNKDHSVTFITVGAIFILMGIWVWIKGWKTHVEGHEVDEYILQYLGGFSLRKRALNELEIGVNDVEEMETYMLIGYSPVSIFTEPYLRVDSEDGKARSSNIQISYFMFDDDLLVAYTQMKSLTDSEFKENSRVWGYKTIKYCELRTVSKLCMTAPGKEEDKEDGDFSLLVITETNNTKYAFAFDEKYRENAKYLKDSVHKRIYMKRRMRKPETNDSRPVVPLTENEEKALKIGVIDEEFKDL